MTSRQLFFWRIYFSIANVIVASMFFDSTQKEALVGIFFLTALVMFFIVKDSAIKRVVTYIKSDDFNNVGAFFKCFITSAFLSLFATIIVIAFVFKSAQDTPISMIAIGFLFLFLGLLFLFKKIRKKPFLFCG